MADFDILKLDYPVYEGVGLPKMATFFENAGKTIQNIQNLKLGPDAVILATFPRSGKSYFTCNVTKHLLRLFHELNGIVINKNSFIFCFLVTTYKVCKCRLNYFCRTL